MPGHFGATATDDGLEFNTNSSTKSGGSGRNDSTTAATAPGGSGVFGLTIAPGGVGVFGANNNPASGRGVQGNGPEAGVGGFSEKGTGVPAQSNHGDGLLASTGDSTKHGVFGRNDSTAAAAAPGGSGVFGLTVAPGGVGVFGANNSPASGRGVQGNGPEAGVGGFSDKGTGGPSPKAITGMAYWHQPETVQRAAYRKKRLHCVSHGTRRLRCVWPNGCSWRRGRIRGHGEPQRRAAACRATDLKLALADSARKEPGSWRKAQLELELPHRENSLRADLLASRVEWLTFGWSTRTAPRTLTLPGRFRSTPVR